MRKHIVITTLASLGLPACSLAGAFQSSKGDVIGGTLIRGLTESHRIEFNLDGKIYRGVWRSGAPTREHKTATRLKVLVPTTDENICWSSNKPCYPRKEAS